MSGPLVLAAAAGAAVVVPAVYIKHHASKQGLGPVLWRILTASRTIDGFKPTDRTLFRPCTPIPQHDRASHLWQRPRIVHLGARTGPPATLLAVLYGLVVAYVLTITILASTAAAGAVGLSWWGYRRGRTWHHRRNHEAPAEAHVGAVVGYVPRAEITRKDGATMLAKFTWKPEAEIREAHKPLILEAVKTRTGIEAPDVTWQLEGRNRAAVFTPSAPPPGLVPWSEVDAIVAGLADDELLIGLGKKRVPVIASFKNDSPHFLLSMGTGAGKSVLAAFLVMQELRRGGMVLILDPKKHSHPWAFKNMTADFAQLPNVAYVSSVEELHEAMVWLGVELDRRNRIATAGMNARGDIIRGDVGPRLLIIAEEINLAEGPLKQYWAEIRTKDQPKRSPAFTGLGAVSFAGRAVKMHLIVIGQMVTAAALGGGAVRENMGVRFLSRYTANNWKMTAGDIPMPPPPKVAGRVQCVMGGEAVEVQVPYMDIKKDTSLIRELAVAGTVTPCPPGMPGAALGRELRGVVVPSPHLSITQGPDLRFPMRPGLDASSPVPSLVTLREAHERGLFGTRKYATVRKAMQRPGAPEPARKGIPGGRAHEYNLTDLIAFAKEIDR